MPQEPPISPFTQLFPTNHAATQLERAQILGLLEQPQIDLQEINSQMLRLKQEIDSLSLRRLAIRDYIRSHKALLSPMRRLPSEVLSEIFFFCTHCLLGVSPVRSVKEAPLLFTRVCRRWRDVVLESPRLWTAIHIYVPEVRGLPREERRRIFDIRAAGLEAWLKRSGALPVSLSLHVSSVNDNPMCALYGLHSTTGIAGYTANAELEYSEFSRVLMALSKRWQNVTLHLPTSMMMTLATALTPEDVPLLERLQLSYRPPLESSFLIDSNADNNFSFSQLKMLRTPALKVLSLTSYGDSPYSLEVQWCNLTELNLQSKLYRGTLKLAEAFGILSRACNLKRCAMGVGLSLPLFPSDDTGAGSKTLTATNPADTELMSELAFGKVIQLPALEVLDLSFILVPSQANIHPLTPCLGDLSYLFDHLLTSHLTSFRFSIGTSFFGTMFQRVPFQDFLSRSSSASETGSVLERFEISMPISDAGLKEALGMMPELKVLVVNEWPIRSSPRPTEGEDVESSTTQSEATISEGLLRALTPPQTALGLEVEAAETQEVSMGSGMDTVILCPKLEDVKFNNCYDSVSGLDTVLVQFAESRWPLKQGSGSGLDEREESTPASSEASPVSAVPSSTTSLSRLQPRTTDVARLRSLQISFGSHGNSSLKSRTGDWATLKRRLTVLMKEGMKLNWVYPGKRKVNDSPWGGLSGYMT